MRSKNHAPEKEVLSVTIVSGHRKSFRSGAYTGGILPRATCITHATIKSTINTKNSNLAISIESKASPPNPKKAATSASTRNEKAQLSIIFISVYFCSFIAISLQTPPAPKGFLVFQQGTRKKEKCLNNYRRRSQARRGSEIMSLSTTEFDVQALVDSHLTWEEEKQVWRGMSSNPALEAYYIQIITQKRLLALWWQNETMKENSKDPPG